MSLLSDDLQAWQVLRHSELAGPDSWLGLVGLFWLSEGDNPVGAAASATVRLPQGPEWLGDLVCRAGRVMWRPAGGEAEPMPTDQEQARIVEHGRLAFFVIERDGQFAARVRDREWARETPFSGLTYFDADPAWQIQAEWVALQPPRLIELPNVSGDLRPVEVTHEAVFKVAGQRYALLPVSVSEEEVFFVFRDRTSGKESYGAGRFLKAGAPANGQLVLDFNRAYNPPCAFTPFATCPLPPPENWLPFAVTAGERKPSKRET